MGKVSWRLNTVGLDGIQLGFEELNRIETVILAAAQDWGQYLDPVHDVSFEIALQITDLPEGVLANAGSDYVNTSLSNDVFNVATPVTLYELEHGVDLNASAGDIRLKLDPALLANAHFETDFDDRRSALPTYQFDLYSIILHELAHGLGILSFRDQGNSITGYFGSSFDALITLNEKGIPLFTGSHASQLNGGKPLHLNSGNVSHIGTDPSDQNSAELYRNSLMAESIAPGQRLSISAVELAILKDLGARVVTPTSGDDVLTGFNPVGLRSADVLATSANLPTDLINILLGQDLLYGGEGHDTMSGLGGHDTIFAGKGNDELRGGRGNDVLEGGIGPDRLFGGDGVDTAAYRTAAAEVTLNLTSGRGSKGNANGDILISIENVIGSDYSDLITGARTNNLLIGGRGNDSLRGSAGDDTLDGGPGRDDLRGGSGFDTADYNSANAPVIVSLTVGLGKRGEAQGDTFIAIENLRGSDHSDILTGSSGNNTLFGGRGNDSLRGSIGDDVLVGGQGNDDLIGGSGCDVFVFDTEPNSFQNLDKIHRYSVRQDEIQLSQSVFDVLDQGRLKNDHFYSLEDYTVQDHDDYILFNPHSGFLYFDEDGSGPSSAIPIAVLTGGINLDADEFFVV